MVMRRCKAADVRLKPGSEYYAAQCVGRRYVLSLDVDRLLAPYRKECGLPPMLDANGDPVQPYPNWESMGMGGHIAGHYLSALAGFWDTLRDDAMVSRAHRLLNGLRECQLAKGTGYVGGIPESDALFSELAAGKVRAQTFELNGAWVPLYNLHKLFAGLIDCWTIFGDGRTPPTQAIADTARDVVLTLAHWWCSVSDGLDDEQFACMLTCEFGGLNESFAALYELTGNERYLREARRFDDTSLLAPLAEGSDVLTGMHANTQIPKVLGYERMSHITGERTYRNAVCTFWDSVVNRRSVSIGAHSVAEHFNDVADFSSMIRSRQGVETCNSYNMAKLSERLFLQTGESKYLDFLERVVENHLVSTVSSAEDGFVYFTPMRPMHYRVYSSPQQSFWCCVGSGLENHARYGRMIYGMDGSGHESRLYINLFISSQLDWKEQDVSVSMSYRYGEGNTNVGVLRLAAADGGPRHTEILIRCPRWCEHVEYSGGSGLAVIANAIPGYDLLTVSWTGGAMVRFTHTVHVGIEGLPDGSAWGSVVRGPKVMAVRGDDMDLIGLVADDSRSGHIASGPLRGMANLPILSSSEQNAFVPHTRHDGTVDVQVYQSDAGGCEHSHIITMVPFSSIEASRYMLYMPWDRDGAIAAVRRNLKAIDTDESTGVQLICDVVQCGEQQSEIDHGYNGRDDVQGREGANHFRSASRGGEFSYRLRDWENVGAYVCIAMLDDCPVPDYRVMLDDIPLKRETRETFGGGIADQYPIEHGIFARHDDLTCRVRIIGVNGDTPRIMSVALLRASA